jgi:hypothetical protein
VRPPHHDGGAGWRGRVGLTDLSGLPAAPSAPRLWL